MTPTIPPNYKYGNASESPMLDAIVRLKKHCDRLEERITILEVSNKATHHTTRTRKVSDFKE